MIISVGLSFRVSDLTRSETGLRPDSVQNPLHPDLRSESSDLRSESQIPDLSSQIWVSDLRSEEIWAFRSEIWEPRSPQISDLRAQISDLRARIWDLSSQIWDFYPSESVIWPDLRLGSGQTPSRI